MLSTSVIELLPWQQSIWEQHYTPQKLNVVKCIGYRSKLKGKGTGKVIGLSFVKEKSNVTSLLILEVANENGLGKLFEGFKLRVDKLIEDFKNLI